MTRPRKQPESEAPPPRRTLDDHRRGQREGDSIRHDGEDAARLATLGIPADAEAAAVMNGKRDRQLAAHIYRSVAAAFDPHRPEGLPTRKIRGGDGYLIDLHRSCSSARLTLLVRPAIPWFMGRSGHFSSITVNSSARQLRCPSGDDPIR